jgi:alcohol dehydrogenase class IV
MNQKEYFGFRSIKNLEEILQDNNSKNIFLVTGKDSYETCGVKMEIEKILRKFKIDFTRFYDFSQNPKLKEIENGLRLFKKENYDLILGVGGGSSIDVAKAIKFFHFQKKENKIPLVAIPTTAGSGSEATYFIVYYIGKEKQSQGKPDLTLPDYAICDPQFVFSLPKNIAASTGMDALSQAVEAYWSVNSTTESKKFSAEAIRLILGNLERAINERNKESREKMMLASNLAGKAINIAKTTACHSIAYPMTSYFGIPHGHAAGMTLGEMLVYNSKVTEKDCNDSRGVDYVKKTINELLEVIDINNIAEASEKIKNLMINIGLETRLSKLGIDEQGMEVMIQNGFKPERVKNNPRVLTEEALRGILERIY